MSSSSSIGPISSAKPFDMIGGTIGDPDHLEKILDDSSTPEDYSVAIQDLHDEIVFPELKRKDLQEICSKIVSDNIEGIKEELYKDVHEAGFIVFDKYRSLMTTRTMTAFKQKYPNLEPSQELVARLEKTVFHRIKRCVGLALEKPVRKAIQEHFPDKSKDFKPNFHSFNQKHPD